MSMDLGGAKGGIKSDINVTPLVDIMLVLLIIFMVTTTYIVNPTIKVDLPKAATATEQAKTTLSLTLSKEGVLYLNGARSDDSGVERFIAAELPKNPDLQAIIAAGRLPSERSRIVETSGWQPLAFCARSWRHRANSRQPMRWTHSCTA